MTHYHAMNGEHGCMPDSNMICESWDAAVESLVDMFEFGRSRARELKNAGYLELRPRDGAAYCEIVPCQDDCDGEDM